MLPLHDWWKISLFIALITIIMRIMLGHGGFVESLWTAAADTYERSGHHKGATLLRNRLSFLLAFTKATFLPSLVVSTVLALVSVVAILFV
jgi:hypothetical protein